jgi:hypothetical protein
MAKQPRLPHPTWCNLRRRTGPQGWTNMCAKLSLPEQRVQDVHDRLGNVFRIGRVDSSEVSPFRAMSGTPVLGPCSYSAERG